MEGKCIENFYSKIGAKLFSERNGLADNVVIKESGVISRNPEVQVSFSNESFDTSQLYDFFINNCNFSKFVEIQSKTHAGVDFNPFEIIGYIISGDFEKDCLKNGYDFAKIGRIPYLDILERNLVNIIADLYSQNGYPLFRKHLPLSICLTHDVDEIAKTYQYFTNALRHFKRMEIKDALREIYGFFHDFLKKENPFWTFEELMELEDSYEVKSTFFFLEETAKTSLTPKSWKHYGRRYKFDDKMVVEIIRSLDKGGWEIALHGSYNSFKDSKLMKLEKERLENVIGKEVSGIRQHNLNLTIPETWKIQEKAGFIYDASLGFKSKDGVGFRWGTSKPFKPYTKQGKRIEILEIPLTVMDVSLENPESGKNIVRELFDDVKKFGEVFCILWHHVLFNYDNFSDWIGLYLYAIELGKLNGAKFLTASQIADLWMRKVNSPLKVIYGKNKAAYSCEYPYVDRLDVI